ncbi:dimethyl sulfoxide reductase [Canicola haemoglobinophilus]|uniref:Oxidoreductase, membrane subunit n=1 Tax=Canicola haemoglobinophilus TaxID=733 RepID=A0A1V4B252_9PAST|nr:DmsC/YnfH family molybdoenzyme membrane anchor subunit [Canicola haemoglobinophilus]OOS01294.1 dimethyl sulfoxide reductase [Canicola haemoglobinophilus]STO60142.1 oxidoreductase, membrane subunit [Canicola haemoglobinophilus]
MNGLHELPLVIFTVLAQSVVGAFLLCSVVLFITQDKYYRVYIHKIIFGLLVLLGVGFFSSIMHLGSPFRALNSLNRIGSSMLSNEIASGALFFALAGSYWLLAISGKLQKMLSDIWLVSTSIVGIIFMYMMNNVYHISTVPTWNNIFTTWNFYLTVILGGLSLGYVLLLVERSDVNIIRRIPVIVAVSLLFAAVVSVYQGFELSSIKTSVQQARALVPDFAILTAVRMLLLGIAVSLMFYLVYYPRSLFVKVMVGCFIIIAEMIGRVLFYALHMTSGMAVGS